MKLALDTNRYVDLARGDRPLVQLIDSAETVRVPFVVVAELRCGFAVGTRGRQNATALQRFLRKPGVDVVFPGDATLGHYAAIYAQLRRQGTPIPTNDMWIAAIAVEHQLALCSRDAHFRHLPQLERIDPTS